MNITKRLHQIFMIGLIFSSFIVAAAAGRLEKDFQAPPVSAQPWVYWFWLNGNITAKGITADLEAMKRAGIGGVLIMEVDQGAPAGPVGFMSPQWRVLFQHATAEADRLGLKINMNNDAGWNGSGGPWIKPEQSMQKVVWTEIDVAGSQQVDCVLTQPQTIAGFYHDIGVLAFPATGSYRIPNIQVKAAYNVGGVSSSANNDLLPEMVIKRDRVIDISARMDSSGHLVWNAPPGTWTVIRFGHTSTGVENSPSPASGRGLECDKLSKEGATANFNGMLAKLIADVGPAAGRTLTATHVDSWENGSQNWTARMREEFLRRRGYDLLRFLPVITGRVIGNLEISERFLWDLRRTISELVIENYAGHLREMAHAYGLQFTIEAYGGPCDSIPYAGQADEPMGEFWDPNGAMETCKGMASAAHVYGKTIAGAEAFTAGDHERWRSHPASIKVLGDQAFCRGINRLVFHRYALQPWTPERKPGMTMGPWGQHYERTQTWWEETPAWHNYLTRCQFLLRKGLFVADVCYLQPEAPPQGVSDHNLPGYGWDECSAEVVLTRMSVRNGRIVLPDGMSYRMLVLPESRIMTPRLLRKIKDLAQAGATIVGQRPLKSPSLTDYPNCDRKVRLIGEELWGICDGQSVKERRFGRGRIVWGVSPEAALAGLGVGPDFTSQQPLHWIHRRMGNTDIYFVSNPHPHRTMATAMFRISGKAPELWWPETGYIEQASLYKEKQGSTSVLLTLEPRESVFVVFRDTNSTFSPVVSVQHNDRHILQMTPERPVKIKVERAIYGVLDDLNRTRDVRTKVQAFADSGKRSFTVAELAADDDPAYGTVKVLQIDYTIAGARFSIIGTDPETINLSSPSRYSQLCELHRDCGRLRLTAWEPGRFTLIRENGKCTDLTVSSLPKPLPVGGPWSVSFPPKSGAPPRATLEHLISLSDHSDLGVKYFSGTAVYRTAFNVPKDLLGKNYLPRLDLGDVQVIAQVNLNGKALGTLWKPPFSIDIKSALRSGRNELEIKVTNLWPNRMIGDEQLPEDSDRNPDGTLKSWPRWLLEGKNSPTGRCTFTSWRMWKKEDTLLKSGLIGPVTIKVGKMNIIN